MNRIVNVCVALLFLSPAVKADVFSYSFAGPLAIADNATTTASINVPLGSGFTSINDLNVLVDLTHTATGDLDIFLIHDASATSVHLFNNFGGLGDNITNVIFDDDAATGIGSVSAPYGPGSFRPDPGVLSAFDGLFLEGLWNLSIVDSFPGDAGTLNSFTISGDANVSAASVPEPSSFAMLFLGGVGVYVVRRRQQTTGVR